MSKTACWATNRLDIDIAILSFGYGSRNDMTTQKYGYQVGLEGAKCLARYDYPYLDDIVGSTERWNNNLSFDDRQKLVDFQLGMWSNKTPELWAEILDFMLTRFSWYQLMQASPMHIHFPGMDKHEAQNKAGEWFKEILSENGKHGCPELMAKYRHEKGNCYDGGELPWKYVYLGARESQFPDAEMFNRINYMFDVANGYVGAFAAWDCTSTQQYMCSDFTERFKMVDRACWWTHDFAELKYPGPITTSTDEEIVKMVELAVNYKNNNFYSYKLERHCEEVHWQMVEERWPLEKIKEWYDYHSDYGNTYMHVLDVYKRDNDQEIEIHLDSRSDDMCHALGEKIIFDKRKVYETWTGDRWWDWHKEQHQKFLDSGKDPNPFLGFI